MSARQDALAAQLRTAMTKQERRSAVRQFQTPETATEQRARLNADLRTYLNALIAEARAAGEGTDSSGGYITPPGFASEVIRLVKEYDSVISDCEDLPTSDGNAWKRPQVSSFAASGAAAAENSQLTDGTSSLISFAGQQSFGRTPTYPAMLLASYELIQDTLQPIVAHNGVGIGLGENVMMDGIGIGNVAGFNKPPVYNGMPTGNGDLVHILASAASEAIGRQVASAASTALYGAAVAGQEVSIGTVTVANIAKLIAKIDAGYLAGAKVYCSMTDYSLLVADDPVKLAALPVPVVPTSAATDFVTTTVSGPVLANLGRFMTMRRVRSQTLNVQVLRERYADNLQVGINVYARVDFQPRGETTAAVFSH